MMRRNANRDGGGRWWLAAATLAVALASAGPVCADPLEPVNRVVFTFNAYAVDYVIDPIARVLKTWVPGPVQIASGNVYENLTEPEFVVAHWLAGNSRAASASLNRLLVNSTLGIGGIFDVASKSVSSASRSNSPRRSAPPVCPRVTTWYYRWSGRPARLPPARFRASSSAAGSCLIWFLPRWPPPIW